MKGYALIYDWESRSDYQDTPDVEGVYFDKEMARHAMEMEAFELRNSWMRDACLEKDDILVKIEDTHALVALPEDVPYGEWNIIETEIIK